MSRATHGMTDGRIRLRLYLIILRTFCFGLTPPTVPTALLTVSKYNSMRDRAKGGKKEKVGSALYKLRVASYGVRLDDKAIAHKAETNHFE